MIDLHIHSRYSDDGEFTPAQLVDMAAQNPRPPISGWKRPGNWASPK